MRSAKIYYDSIVAGKLIETDDGEYNFTYTQEYVKGFPIQFITFSLPVRSELYVSKRLFPFFEGLIPEGGCWILHQKIGKSIKMIAWACCWHVVKIVLEP